MSQAVLTRLGEQFPEAIVETGSQHGDEWALVQRDAIREICTFLRDDPEMAFELPVDLTAVDYRDWDGGREPRFDVIYHLYSVSRRHRIRLKVRVSEDDPNVSSVSDLYPGLSWFEREVWDMFGLRFEGHPKLKRVLLYEEFEGHPLRKEFPHRSAQARVPMRELPDADIKDAALGPATRPGLLAGEPLWSGEETVPATGLRPGIPGLPDPGESSPSDGKGA